MTAHLLLSGAILSGAATAQAGSPQQQTAVPVVRVDAQVDAAESMIGRALFLRCFCTGSNLSFDSAGRHVDDFKTTDWTLAGVNVLKVERRGPGTVELEGVRAAVRFNPDNREWQRRPQNDEKVKIQVADAGDVRGFKRALDTVFAQGIDPGLQRAMPDYWRHYFDPLLSWGWDDLSGQVVYIPGPNGQTLSATGMLPLSTDAKGPLVSEAVLIQRTDAAYTAEAQKDRAKGGVVLRLVVDAEGRPQRIQVYKPLGYGLDASAVEALQKFRFKPALREGSAVASVLLMNEDFTPVQARP